MVYNWDYEELKASIIQGGNVETFTETNKVFLVNLRETGHSEKAKEPYQLSRLESIFDLEALREKLGFVKWGFVGHSTGGILGIVSGILEESV